MRDSVVDIMQCVGNGLHALAAVVDGEIALCYDGELIMEKDGVGFFVRLKQGLDGDPELAGGLIRCHGEVLDVSGDGAEEPAMDA